MGVHDDVRTDARVTEWHVFLRDDQAADTWGREDFAVEFILTVYSVILRYRSFICFAFDSVSHLC